MEAAEPVLVYITFFSHIYNIEKHVLLCPLIDLLLTKINVNRVTVRFLWRRLNGLLGKNTDQLK